MIKQIVLTEEEYDALLTKQTEPSNLLRDTNATLLAKVTKLQKKLDEGSFERVQLNTPFILKDDKLVLQSKYDFITLYNQISYSKSLKDKDMAMYKYLYDLATMYGVTAQLSDASKVKAYRVRLQKQDIVALDRTGGCITLSVTKVE